MAKQSQKYKDNNIEFTCNNNNNNNNNNNSNTLFQTIVHMDNNKKIKYNVE